MKQSALFAVTLAATLLVPVTPGAQDARPADPVLKPTNHPRLPAEFVQYWMAPGGADARAAQTKAMKDFAEAVRLEVDSNFARALPLLSPPALQQSALGEYAIYYQGLAEMRLGRPADARQTFQRLAAKPPVGYLVEGAALREAEADEALGDPGAALAIYERLSQTKTSAPEEVLMRVGRTAKATSNADKAVEAYSRVLYEFPFSDVATVAAAELDRLPVAPLVAGSTRYKLELGRGERFFGAKRYSAARPIFENLRRVALGDDREIVDLRLAECDYFLKRARSARDGARPYTDKGSRQGEALFFYAVASRELGDHGEYLRTVRHIVNDFPEQSWAEEALNNLATHYIVQDEDDLADATFREMYRKFPTGRYAERAAWKLGWWAYRSARYADAVAAFESAASNFPRSDYRPSWLYWSGRAHEALKEKAVADARYTLVATDYLNSYYGRLAVVRLNGQAPQRRLTADVPATPADDGAVSAALVPPNAPTVRALLALDLYDQAVDELRYAQKAWGDSSVIQATFAWVYNQRGDLRAGINAMKRAYPQYMAAGGEHMPTPLLKVLFPVDYWPLIKRYSAERELDPYMMAALIAQESNFTADIKSAANAYGLMQLLPATGRQYARRLQISRSFSMRLLTTAEPNLKMGTAYFADLVHQFGGVHYALATYNAGPGRVSRWIAERPGIERDEFIDGIPFPETQNYVKRILGTAEDYRRLYGPTSGAAGDEDDVRPAVATAKTTAAKKKTPSAKAPAPKPKPSSSRARRPAKAG
jgi:soluble lytic murein transglycosylase